MSSAPMRIALDDDVELAEAQGGFHVSHLLAWSGPIHPIGQRWRSLTLH
jgi:hypothetical protein